MLEHIQRIIDELKMKIKFNINMISRNQAVIKNMHQQNELTEEAMQYENFTKQNKLLLAQNNDLINVQLTLINFIEKYKDTAVLKDDVPVVDIYSISDSDEIFTMTVKNVVPFNFVHPYYYDTNFIDKLIAYYKQTEEYEICTELTHLKEKILS